MKKAFVIGLVCAMLVLLAVVPQASAYYEDVMYDNFDSYATDDDFKAVWSTIVGTGCTITLTSTQSYSEPNSVELTDTDTGARAVLARAFGQIDSAVYLAFWIAPLQRDGYFEIRLNGKSDSLEVSSIFIVFDDSGLFAYGSEDSVFTTEVTYAKDKWIFIEIAYNIASQTYTAVANTTHTICEDVAVYSEMDYVNEIMFSTSQTLGTGNDFFIDNVNIDEWIPEGFQWDWFSWWAILIYIGVGAGIVITAVVLWIGRKTKMLQVKVGKQPPQEEETRPPPEKPQEEEAEKPFIVV